MRTDSFESAEPYAISSSALFARVHLSRICLLSLVLAGVTVVAACGGVGGGGGEDGDGLDIDAETEVISTDVAVVEGVESASTPGSAVSVPEGIVQAPGEGTPVIDKASLSPERYATLSAWAATQEAAGGEGMGEMGDLIGRMGPGQPGVEGSPGSAILEGESTGTLEGLGIEAKTPYDQMALQAAIGLFSTQVGRAEADMQNLGLHVVTTNDLAKLRGSQPMPIDARATSGNVWIVVFDTSEPLVAGTFLPENIDELGDVDANSALAGPDGRTTIYYTLSLANDFSRGRFVALGKGVLNDRTLWSRADLEALDSD